MATAGAQGVITVITAEPLTVPLPQALLTLEIVKVVDSVGATVNTKGDAVILVKTCPVLSVRFQGLDPVKATESETVCPGMFV